jgi:Ca-activated chloride channel family protein
MQSIIHRRRTSAALIALLFLLTATVLAQDGSTSKTGPTPPVRGQLTISSRPATPLFKSKQGEQKTEIHYDPATQTVTLKVLVQDPHGYFIPNLHPNNFVVYENGVPQHNAQVSVEHTAVSLALLMEYGGRILPLNKLLGTDVTSAAQQLVAVLTPADKVWAWTYSDTVHKIADTPEDSRTLDTQLLSLESPGFSEADLYDSLLFVTAQMKPVAGRKAIVLISSGINTFSKATYQDVLTDVGSSDSPVYVLGLTTILREYAENHGQAGSLGLVDWKKAQRELEEIATLSGGRAYFPDDAIDLSPIYDDMMENLKVRYVVTYKSSNNGDLNAPRTVRVELINPATGGPLRIVDEHGATVQARVVAQESYIPAQASQH